MKTKVISLFMTAIMLLTIPAYAEETKNSFNINENITVETTSADWQKDDAKENFSIKNEKTSASITTATEKAKLEDLAGFNCQMTVKDNDKEIFVIGHVDKREALTELIAIMDTIKSSDNKELAKEVNVTYFVDVDSALNVREAPTTNSKAIGKVKNNEEVFVEAFTLNTETNSVWAQIKYNDTHAFVSANYIKPEKEAKANSTTTDNNTSTSSPTQSNTTPNTPQQSSQENPTPNTPSQGSPTPSTPAQENTTPSTPSQGNTTLSTPTQPSTPSNPSQPSQETTQPTSPEPTQPVHQHTWTTQTRIVQDAYDETVVTTPAWDEQVWHDGEVTGYQYSCNCGACFGSKAEINQHQFEAALNGDTNHTGVAEIPITSEGYYTTVHHDAETTVVHHNAETETYQVCSTCGATQ